MGTSETGRDRTSKRLLRSAQWLHSPQSARRLLSLWFFFFLFFFFLVFLGLYPCHMEVARLLVELELVLPAYAIAIATPDLSPLCHVHYSSWPHWILNPLSKARDWTCVLMDTSQIRFHWATTGTPQLAPFLALGNRETILVGFLTPNTIALPSVKNEIKV